MKSTDLLPPQQRSKRCTRRSRAISRPNFPEPAPPHSPYRCLEKNSDQVLCEKSHHTSHKSRRACLAHARLGARPSVGSGRLATRPPAGTCVGPCAVCVGPRLLSVRSAPPFRPVKGFVLVFLGCVWQWTRISRRARASVVCLALGGPRARPRSLAEAHTGARPPGPLVFQTPVTGFRPSKWLCGSRRAWPLMLPLGAFPYFRDKSHVAYPLSDFVLDTSKPWDSRARRHGFRSGSGGCWAYCDFSP